MAAVTTIPGTSYRLDGGVLAGELYVSASGCVYRRGAEGVGTRLSVAVVRQDGVQSTFTLDGWWRVAGGSPESCYRRVEPKAHFQRFFGAVQGALGTAASAAGAAVAEVRALVAKELPALEPFLELATRATGVDPKMLAGTLLAGAKDAGIPINTVADLVTAPEATVRTIARNAAIELGIDPALLGLGATPASMRPPAGEAKRRIMLAGLCFEADATGQLTRVDCKSGRPLGQPPAPTSAEPSGMTAGHVVLLVLGGAVVAAVLYFVLRDRGR